jgi:quercetin dioxygenase-like cupin family protein
MRQAALIAITIALAATPAAAQIVSQPAPKPGATHTYMQGEPVSGLPGKSATMQSVAWPAGSTTGRQSNNGDEYALVTEGNLTVNVTGSASRVYRAGEAYHIAGGVVYEIQNMEPTTAYTVEFQLIDQGKPAAQPAR